MFVILAEMELILTKAIQYGSKKMKKLGQLPVNVINVIEPREH